MGEEMGKFRSDMKTVRKRTKGKSQDLKNKSLKLKRKIGANSRFNTTQ